METNKQAKKIYQERGNKDQRVKACRAAKALRSTTSTTKNKKWKETKKTNNPPSKLKNISLKQPHSYTYLLSSSLSLNP